MADIQLETPRLILREFERSDFTDVHRYSSDPEVTRYVPWGPNSEQDSHAFLDRMARLRAESPRLGFALAIVEKATKRVIGGGGLHERNLLNRSAALGYTLARDRWGQGFATEVALALRDFGFVEFDLHRLWATTSPDNAASMRVLEKIGMRLEGTMRGHSFVRGTWRDSALYAMISSDPR